MKVINCYNFVSVHRIALQLFKMMDEELVKLRAMSFLRVAVCCDKCASLIVARPSAKRGYEAMMGATLVPVLSDLPKCYEVWSQIEGGIKRGSIFSRWYAHLRFVAHPSLQAISHFQI